MSDNKVPYVTEGQEKILAALFDTISKANSAPIHTLLATGPIKDDIFQGLAIDAEGVVKTADRHAADRFVLYVQSDKNSKARSNYFGQGERVRDEQSRTGFGYSPETMKELRQEVGLRLSRLNGLDRKIYFTSDIIPAEGQEVTPEFIGSLLSSDKKELGFIEIKILED